jgi:hypothetical protein
MLGKHCTERYRFGPEWTAHSKVEASSHRGELFTWFPPHYFCTAHVIHSPPFVLFHPRPSLPLSLCPFRNLPSWNEDEWVFFRMRKLKLFSQSHIFGTMRGSVFEQVLFLPESQGFLLPHGVQVLHHVLNDHRGIRFETTQRISLWTVRISFRAQGFLLMGATLILQLRPLKLIFVLFRGNSTEGANKLRNFIRSKKLYL